ncbi:MAG: hypothetical protein UR28_C0001G0074 [Candidatus Peregrinibacteria bacterium GW2011_GWF2_33_10]|nr:MAG: hypothetical protein UR28_C0001G0074 [Candidatus Peregrinibacteria bacterium GW2011_GWF2_33_10]OGJ44820.1 MAG: hypothetical protein A2263_06305 [Candidatus Peregrinibacteria bacterium RIFOXYA2_FULL_33_21]OGJ47106.1 MAG: hypothetical protein A2272_03025 [Candidatus Peregrinibacteria bacterium RIFOXYA12_FULL_33_12]OGJ50506.1 MAG: hypothetical protein A2307_02930 [Candidatus Peregrinibacteria bacterium RIFOXYB2_FULL_33_20]
MELASREIFKDDDESLETMNALCDKLEALRFRNTTKAIDYLKNKFGIPKEQILKNLNSDSFYLYPFVIDNYYPIVRMERFGPYKLQIVFIWQYLLKYHLEEVKQYFANRQVPLL